MLPSITELKNILEMSVCLCHQNRLTAPISVSLSHVSNGSSLVSGTLVSSPSPVGFYHQRCSLCFLKSHIPTGRTLEANCGAFLRRVPHLLVGCRQSIPKFHTTNPRVSGWCLLFFLQRWGRNQDFSQHTAYCCATAPSALVHLF